MPGPGTAEGLRVQEPTLTLRMRIGGSSELGDHLGYCDGKEQQHLSEQKKMVPARTFPRAPLIYTLSQLSAKGQAVPLRDTILYQQQAAARRGPAAGTWAVCAARARALAAT